MSDDGRERVKAAQREQRLRTRVQGLVAHVEKTAKREHALRLKYKSEVPSLKRTIRDGLAREDALRQALRDVAIIQGHDESPGRCYVCGAKWNDDEYDWSRSGENERHEPDCLAAPARLPIPHQTAG